MKRILSLAVVVLALSAWQCRATPTPVVVEKTVVETVVVETERIVEKPVVVKLDITPRLAVVSAFGSELEKLLGVADITNVYVIGGVTYHVGTLAGNNVVMFLSGVSMVNAAMTVERVITHFNVVGIVYSGIAGGVNPQLRIGDVTVPAEWGQYLEAYFARETGPGEFTPPPWYQPEFKNFGMIFPKNISVVNVNSEPDKYQPVFWFPVDAEMLAVAKGVARIVDLDQCTPKGVCLEHDPLVKVGGRGVSGQAFVDNADFRSFVFEALSGDGELVVDALDMESAGASHVAYTWTTPFIAFRSLSDLAGGGPGENEIQTFFQLAADNSAKLVLAFLKEWAEPGSVTGGPAKPFKVAFVYVGPVGDLGWSYAHDQGRLAVEDMPGVETSYSELVAEGADAERVIRDYAQKGYNMIFATSFGYMDSVITVAEEFPNVLFEHATGYKTAKNASIYDGRGYEGWYLAGITAGRMTKTNVLGYVAPYIIPEVLRNMNAFTRGARSVNPNVTVHPVWIFTWFDPPKEREATQALADLGADVIARESDSPEPDKLAEEAGLYAIGYNAISPDVAPKAVLTAPIWDWGVYYKQTVEAAMKGEWKTYAYWGHMADGILDLAPFGTMVPQAVRDEVNAVKGKIISGELHPFTGPIRDNQGELRVAEGQVMTDEQLLSFDWLVEGVVGTIPK